MELETLSLKLRSTRGVRWRRYLAYGKNGKSNHGLISLETLNHPKNSPGTKPDFERVLVQQLGKSAASFQTGDAHWSTATLLPAKHFTIAPNGRRMLALHNHHNYLELALCFESCTVLIILITCLGRVTYLVESGLFGLAHPLTHGSTGNSKADNLWGAAPQIPTRPVRRLVTRSRALPLSGEFRLHRWTIHIKRHRQRSVNLIVEERDLAFWTHKRYGNQVK